MVCGNLEVCNIVNDSDIWKVNFVCRYEENNGWDENIFRDYKIFNFGFLKNKFLVLL